MSRTFFDCSEIVCYRDCNPFPAFRLSVGILCPVRLPCLGYVDSIAHILPKVKYYFRFFRKWFLTFTRGEGSDFRVPSPVCAMRSSFCPLCPCCPCRVDGGAHGLVSSARAFPGGLLLAVPCDCMRLCRCMTFEESKGGRGGALARCLPTWIAYHILSYLSTHFFIFFCS